MPSTTDRHTLALLSSLLPGLGQWAAGRRRVALVFLLPAVGALLGLVAALVVSDPMALAAHLLDPAALDGLLAAIAIVSVFRFLAVADAYRGASGAARSPRVALTVLALALVVGPGAGLGALTLVARESLAQIYSPAPLAPEPAETPSPDDATAIATPSPAASVSPSPTATPVPVDRVTYLLIGMDSGVGRRTSLTDTMIVASLERSTGSVSLVSIPRDMVDVPLGDGRVFRPKVNSLVAYARRNPSEFPDATYPQDVLASALGSLLGVRVDGWAQVNLGGFVAVVNSVGGVDVTVTRPLCDPAYDEYGFPAGFSISPGRYHFDGNFALAYARIRKSAGESDFTRAARQQQVVVALRDRIMAGGLLADPVGFLRSIGGLVSTDVEPAEIAELAALAARVDRSAIFRAVVGHPLVRSGYDVRGSIQIPDLPAIAALGARAFGPGLPTDLVALPDDSSAGSGARPSITGCRGSSTPRPGPSASPSLSPSPSANPPLEPTPTFDPLPSASPSPAPTATPSASPSPLPSPSETPTPEPTA